MANARVHVVDRYLGLLPAGVTGEVCIAGVQVARGYLGRPGLTAERFVADPVAGDGSRMYRSGDLGRWRADGVLEFAGRADGQVKVRGFRVEPGEVEAALAAHPGVAAAAVTAFGGEGERRLAAWVVAADPAAGVPGGGVLREFLAGRLPGYMVPAVFTGLGALPVSPAGKVDRAALPDPGGARPGAGGYVAPAAGAEAVLAQVWAELLGVDRVGARDNFFDLGGDSIISIRVVARARERGVHVSAAQLFDHQTVAELAAAAGRQEAVTAGQGPGGGAFALSPAQLGFFALGLPEPWHFNQSVLLEVTGAAAEPGLLEAAAGAVAAHHDALRSRFARDAGGAWSGRVAAAEAARLVQVAGEGPEAEEEAAEAAQRGLSLEEGPLLRLVVLGGGRRVLAVVHHLVTDAVSWTALLEDLGTAYEQAERGEPVRLPPRTTSFAAWSRRLAELAAGPVTAAEAGYWERAAAGGGPLPRDLGGDNTLDSARQVTVALGAGPTGRLLREVPAAYRTQVNDALLAALGTVLGRWAGAAQVAVDVESHGRHEDLGGPGTDLSRTAGWFTSVYPVLLDGPGGGGPGGSLLAAKRALRAVPRHGLGYGLLRHLAGQAGQAGSGRAGRRSCSTTSARAAPEAAARPARTAGGSSRRAGRWARTGPGAAPAST